MSSRLPSYERGNKLRHRMFLGMTRLFWADLDDVAESGLKRPEFFGVPLFRLAQDLLRGPSQWSADELHVSVR